MSTALDATGRSQEFGFVWLVILFFICVWIARREVRRPASSIRLGPPQLVPLAADQAVVAAELLATTLTPFLSGDNAEATA